ESPMPIDRPPALRLRILVCCLALLAGGVLTVAPAQEKSKRDAPADTAAKGVRVFSCGHSFHYFMPPILSEMAKGAGVTDHQALGLSAIGGSRVIQHWDVPDYKNKAKEA